MDWRAVIALPLSLVISAAAFAMEDPPALVPRAEDEVKISPWDGVPEDGLGWDPTVTMGEYVQRFDYSSGQLTRIEICMLTNPGTEVDAMASIVLYDVGPGGNPGSLLFQSDETSLTVPGFPNHNCVPIATGGIPVDGPIYAGLKWRPDQYPDVFVPMDTTLATPQQVLRGRSQVGDTLGPWGDVTDFATEARAFGIGIVGVIDGSVSPVCTPGPTVMCLNDERFKVELDWRRVNNQRGPGEVVQQGSDDSGLFYFFDPDNWEMLIKVIDACNSAFNSFWVFYAATTNVEFTVTVTDTQTGVVNNYFNPLENPALPIQDTSAFATCP